VTEGTIGLGIIGLGRWANAHANAIARTPGVALVDCHARSESTRTDFANRHGVRSQSATYDQMLANPDLDAVIVSTPNDLHVPHALAAIEAGKPVLVDKPICVDIPEGLSLWRAAGRTGVPVGVAHHSRRLAGVRTARAWVESEQSGDVRIAHADFSNARGASMSPDAWHRTARGSDAGVLIQVGIHPVENLLYVLGPAVEVNARYSYRTLGPTMPDAVALAMVHASGAMSLVSSSWSTPGHFTMEILGTNGNLAYRLDHGHWPSGDIDDHGELSLDLPGEPTRPLPVDKGDPLRTQIEELAASMGGNHMQVAVADGLRAMLVVLAATTSAGLGGAPVDLGELLVEAGATAQEIQQLLSP
jgi:predicted dehydrogenase